MMADNFIKVYDNALSAKECQILIDYYEKSPKVPGKIFINGSGSVDPSRKKSLELQNSNFSDNSTSSSIILTALDKCVIKYKESYPSLDSIYTWKYDEYYAFKKFEGEDGGYKDWHTEHGPGLSSYRILVWSFFLNNAKSGTTFMHFPNIRAKMGRCVIWPSGWQYLHKSTPNKGVKYYVSGWFSYEK